jgi:hypothetical protein
MATIAARKGKKNQLAMPEIKLTTAIVLVG